MRNDYHELSAKTALDRTLTFINDCSADAE